MKLLRPQGTPIYEYIQGKILLVLHQMLTLRMAVLELQAETLWNDWSLGGLFIIRQILLYTNVFIYSHSCTKLGNCDFVSKFAERIEEK